MEDDKKKRKNNKKKKNKQQAKAKAKAASSSAGAADDTSSNAGDTSSHEQNHAEERSVGGDQEDESNPNNVLVVEERDDGCNSNGIDGPGTTDTEKQEWLQEEARLREMIKQLLYEKDSYIQQQTDLESRLKQLQCESESWHQKEVGLEERISQLVQEKADVSIEEENLQEQIRHTEKELVARENSSKEMISALKTENTRLEMQHVATDSEKHKWLQEEARLREMVKQLLSEKDSYMQQQIDLESRFKQLQCESDSWHQKEVGLEERISQLIQEKTDVIVEEGNLQEKVRHTEELVAREKSSKELISALKTENTRLEMQVLELEGARFSLSQENRHLLDKISTLESRILDLERSLPPALSPVNAQKDASEKEDLNAQIDAACTLVEKLVTENAELVEKLNELYGELDRMSVVPNVTSLVVPDDAAVPDPVSGSGENVFMSSSSARDIEVVPIGHEGVTSYDVDSKSGNLSRHFSETSVSEIVQIPLEENEGHDLEAQVSLIEGEDGVPITDAPLIGAPFRLISFVAKYVSGADLVDKSSSDTQLVGP